jgi:1-phosphatidylinositol-5-phosphate 4-kinase
MPDPPPTGCTPLL